MIRLRAAVLAGLALVCGLAGGARAVTLPELIGSDMTQPHEMRPHGVPHNYQWYPGPFQSPAAPAEYTSVTAWGQWYRCETAGLDDNDVLEISKVQTWELSNTGVWTGPLQTGVLGGAAYPENFQGSPVPANVVAQSPDSSWIKVRMSRDGYNFHFYPRARAAYDPATTAAVVVVAEARLIAYGPTTQCTVLGMGADYWPTYNATSGVKGATLGRLKHVGGWRAYTATAGDVAAVQANPPPVTLPASEIR